MSARYAKPSIDNLLKDPSLDQVCHGLLRTDILHLAINENA